MRRRERLTHIERRGLLIIILVTATVMWGMHAHTVRRADTETDSERAEPPGPHFESEYAVGIVPIEELPNEPMFPERTARHAALFAAIRQVEWTYGPQVGKAGELGRYQISPDYWYDACDYAVDMGYLTEEWDYDTLVWHATYCEQIMLFYWEHYGATTDEDRARCHYAGWQWRTRAREDSLIYWRRVNALMERDAE